MRKKIVPIERKPDVKLATFKGLSGLRIEVNTAYCDAGRQAILPTGEEIQVLGFVPLGIFNTIAIRLASGQVTTVAPEELQYKE